MGITDGLEAGIGDAIQKVKDVSSNISPTTAVIGGSVLGAGIIGGAIGLAKRKKKKSKKSKRKKSKGRKLKFGSKAFRKKYLNKHKTSKKGKTTYHKHRKNKGIHYTKKGQPYIILSSGKARFIKMSSASNRKKRKGGYY